MKKQTTAPTFYWPDGDETNISQLADEVNVSIEVNGGL